MNLGVLSKWRPLWLDLFFEGGSFHIIVLEVSRAQNDAFEELKLQNAVKKRKIQDKRRSVSSSLDTQSYEARTNPFLGPLIIFLEDRT